MVFISAAGFVPIAFVDRDHFARMAGDAAVGEEVRRVGEDEIDAEHPHWNDFLQRGYERGPASRNTHAIGTKPRRHILLECPLPGMHMPCRLNEGGLNRSKSERN